MHFDLLAVVLTMVIMARCSVIKEGKSRVRMRGLRGLHADGESKKDRWDVVIAAAYLGEWLWGMEVGLVLIFSKKRLGIRHRSQSLCLSRVMWQRV